MTFLAKCVLVLLATALVCAFLAASPVIFCHGGGSGGNCGEAVMLSLPATLLVSPLILILATVFFFPSARKILLIVLGVMAVAELALVGFSTKLVIDSKDHSDQTTERQAVFMYSVCLEGNARGRSRTSNDPPEAIEQSSFANCAKGRQQVFDTFRSHANSFSPEAMAALEQEFRRKLPQIIVKTRGDVRKTVQR